MESGCVDYPFFMRKVVRSIGEVQNKLLDIRTGEVLATWVERLENEECCDNDSVKEESLMESVVTLKQELEKEYFEMVDVKPRLKIEIKVENDDFQHELKSEREGDGIGKFELQSGMEEPKFECKEESKYKDCCSCVLDGYTSDLHLNIDPNSYCSAAPVSEKGFGLLWAGVRATHGVRMERACYEVKVTGNMKANGQGGFSKSQFVTLLRCGWSVNSSYSMLGEDQNSFGFDGLGQVSEGNRFRDYGVRFSVGDVVGCFIDMTGDLVVISYSVNGINQGVAFKIQKKTLKGEALFPHILTRNQKFTVNFGQKSPYYNRSTLSQHFHPIGHLSPALLVPGPIPPPSKADCKVIMMVGLPGAGKTFLAQKLSRNNPDQNWNILGTNVLLERLSVEGHYLNYNEKWESFQKIAGKCFKELLVRAAARSPRNYILDQTNVVQSARRWKIEYFEGFQCSAVVVVPTGIEYKRRFQNMLVMEGKEVSESVVLDMKSKFVLPDLLLERAFTSVIYTDMENKEAMEMVNEYRREVIGLSGPKIRMR